MTYDTWKASEPNYDDDESYGTCDVCEKWRPVSRCWATGIETFACDECRGFEEDDDQERYEYETGGAS